MAFLIPKRFYWTGVLASIWLAGHQPFAQDASPSPTPPVAAAVGASPSASVSPSATPQLPPDLLPNPNSAPSVAQPKSAPDLLPESRPLPSATVPPPVTNDLIPSGSPIVLGPTPKAKPLAEKAVREKIRFRQILSVAQGETEAIRLNAEAERAGNLEYKREWLQAYDRQVAATMRRLDPSLKVLVDTWERTKIFLHTQHNIKPTVPLYKYREGER